MGGHVFISYRHGADGAYVERLSHVLANAGIDVWFDRQIMSGDQWERVIKQKIDTCDAFVVVMTPESEDSEWVARELIQAEKSNRPVLPVLLAGEGFFRLNNRQFEDVRNGRLPGPEFIAQLTQLMTPAASTAGTPPAFDMNDLFGPQETNDVKPASDSADGRGLADLFGGLFGPKAQPERGRDVEAEVILELRDAVLGATLPITVKAAGNCPRCDGSGIQHGHTCRTCQGSGKGEDVTGTINVRFPPGVRDGQRIRLKGRGERGKGAAGDLYVAVKVKPDPLFALEGDDITMTVEITFADAVLGLDLRLPTLDGAVTLRLPPGTPSGRTLRVRGHGLRRRDGSHGDLLVTVEVAIPLLNSLDSHAINAIQQLRHMGPAADRRLVEEALQQTP